MPRHPERRREDRPQKALWTLMLGGIGAWSLSASYELSRMEHFSIATLQDPQFMVVHALQLFGVVAGIVAAKSIN